jgi:hypothetical protein
MDPSCTWPGSQPDDLRRTSGMHRCSRACEVHARYIAGGDISHCDSSNQVTPNSSSKTAASPHGCPGLTNPADERSGQPRPLCPPAKCHVPRTVTPVISAPPSRPPALRENTGPPGGHRGSTPDSAARQAGTSRLRGPSVAVRGNPAGTPTVPAARTPSAMRPWMPQHSTQQRDKVTHDGTAKKRPA